MEVLLSKNLLEIINVLTVMSGTLKIFIVYNNV
jgi:hypothetical protein